MIKFISLFSGSSGNSYFLQVDENKFLVDVGVTNTKIEQALKSIGEKIEDIQAILITHEHIDHVRGLYVINKKHGIPIYIKEETLNKINDKDKAFNKETINLFSDKKFKINKTKVSPFSIPHDAIDPVGFSFFDKNNKKITIVTDLGEITKEVYKNVLNTDILVLEANYDDELIKYSEYPVSLLKRIVSKKGHLPNSESLNLVSNLADQGLSKIALAHISKNNNNPEIVYQLFENLNKNKNEEEKIYIQILKDDKPGKEIRIE